MNDGFDDSSAFPGGPFLPWFQISSGTSCRQARRRVIGPCCFSFVSCGVLAGCFRPENTDVDVGRDLMASA